MAELPPTTSSAAPAQITTLAYHTATSDLPTDWSNVTTHGIRPDLIHMEWRRTLQPIFFLTLPMSLAFMAMMLWIVRADSQALTIVLILMPTFIVLALGIRIFRARRQFNARWPTFRIVLSNQGVLRSRRDVPDLRIVAGDITELREIASGILLRGTRRVDVMLLPRSLEHYDQVRERLAIMHSMRVGGGWLRSKIAAINLLLVGGFFAGMLTTNTTARWVLIVMLATISIWSIVQSLRSPNLTLRQKIVSPLILIFPGILLVQTILPDIWQRLFP